MVSKSTENINLERGLHDRDRGGDVSHPTKTEAKPPGGTYVLRFLFNAEVLCIPADLFMLYIEIKQSYCQVSALVSDKYLILPLNFVKYAKTRVFFPLTLFTSTPVL